MKTMTAHAVLAAMSLGLAWRLSTSEAEGDEAQEKVELFACGSFSELTYTSKSRTLAIEARTLGGEPGHWLTVTPAAPEASTPQRAPAPAPKPTQFLLNDGEGGQDWLDALRPLVATRSLGEVQEDVLEDLGLGDEADSLSLRCDSNSADFRVGSSTFGAQGHRYLQRKDGGPVFLVERAVVTRLAQADSQLARRTLHDFPSTDIDQLEVRAEGKSLTLKQRDRHNPTAAFWVDASRPEERNDLFGNWMSRVDALAVRGYLAPDARPGADLDGTSEGDVVMELVYMDAEGKPLGQLSLARAQDPEDPGTYHYYGKSEETRGWVTLPASVARDVENNGRSVVGLDPLPEAASPPPGNTEAGVSPPATPAPQARPTSGGGPLPPGHP